MPVFNSGAVFEVAIHGQQGSGQADIVNVYKLQMTGVASQDWTDILDDMLEWAELIVDLIKLAQTVYTSWRGITVRTLNSSDVSGFLPFASNIAGTRNEDTNPTGCAALLYFSTGISRKQPRKYIGPLGDGMTDTGGGLNATALGLLEDVVDFLLVPQSVGAALYTYGTAQPAGTFYPVIEGAISTEPAYQRRRKRFS